MTNKITAKTWLPVFPGFYGTIFEPDDENLFYNLDKEDGLFQPELDEVASLKCYNNAYNETKDTIVRGCVSFIESELNELGVISSIKLEKLVSPREYNFQNDSINVIIEFSDDNIQKIKDIIKDNSQAWADYLKDTYTSCSGFISSHDNTPDSDEWSIDNAIKDDHNCGAILQFICDISKIDDEALYYGMSESTSIWLYGSEVRDELKENGFYKDNPDVLLSILESGQEFDLSGIELSSDDDDDIIAEIRRKADAKNFIKELEQNNLKLFAKAV